MATVRPISEKKIEANRRNAQQSTGPRTEAGKHASRLNAVSHGLLAKAVVITAGDYQEDAEEFAQLLDGLRTQFTPEGAAEDLEVQQIALCYWRKMRAVRYEHGAIRTRTGDLRERDERRREDSFEDAVRFGSNLERSSRGIQYLIDHLEYVKQEILDGTVSEDSREWLEQHFPGECTLADGDQNKQAAGPVQSKNSSHQTVASIDKQLHRLSLLRDKMATIEELKVESKISAGALPAPAMVDRLVRYETSNDRALDRALHRLEGIQARRRKPGGPPAGK